MDTLLASPQPLPPPLESETDGADLTTQQSFKLVPWISWDEWSFVNHSLFSSSPSSVSAALRRVATWRSRGCIPVAVDVTASIIEIQQKDHFFRKEIDGNAEQSEEMLSMLYSMAIMRLVNAVVEKTRKKNEMSIAAAADEIGLPRMLIDVRHEGSHRDLPSLPLVRLASSKALDWLKSYYWQPQKSALSVGSDVITNLRKEITQKLLQLASCLNVNKSIRSSSSPVKRKRSKKDIAKAVKDVLRLYSSDSSEVATTVIEMLLKASESSDLIEVADNSEYEGNDVQTGHDWNAIILKLSRKEPELLPTLMRAALNKYEIQTNCDDYLPPQNITQFRRIDKLARLFKWLLSILKHVQRKKSGGKLESSFELPNSTLFEFMRKCLMASSHGDNQLMSSALVLANMMGNSSLTNKLVKLSLLNANTEKDTEVLSSDTDSETFFSSQEDSIRQATQKFELIKSGCLRNSNVELIENPVKNIRWKVVNSWKQCPIGMLPHTIGFSGRLPVLDLNDDKETETPSGEGQGERDQSRGKRESEHDVASIDDSSLKKLRTTTLNCESDKEGNSTLECLTGHLMIDGVWKKVSGDELNAISSAVEIWALPLNLPRVSNLKTPLQRCSTEGEPQSASVG